MPIRARENVIGAWAFLVGIVIAVLAGFYTAFQTNPRDITNPVVFGVLAILGLVGGFFVSENNVQTFLLASVSLVVVSFASIQGLVLSAAVLGISIGKIIVGILNALIVFFTPATIIVALKTVFSLAKR